MFRYRRYRVFLVFAVVVVFTLYKFGDSSTSWREQAAARFGQGGNADPPQLNWQPKPEVATETKKLEIEVPAAKNPQVKQTPPPVAPANHPGEKSHTSTAPKPTSTATGKAQDARETGLAQNMDEAVLSSTEEAIHWSKTKEHFPIATESIVPLPSGKSKQIPKIQFDFKPETTAEKADREAKLEAIKNVFKRSWSGYKEYAWLQDEVKPVSGSAKNPFAGWGATLVDALDTLWIMDLKDDFEEAVKAVDKIDFTTTSRPDIPLFETTIRYLGGLLAAYDISGKKHENLLVKAKELAEILLAAFDTPNRMPQTYYYWRPDFASNAHPASNRVVLAEIGSLSMEFTRLAQLTGEHKYYDAIARITDNLEGYQNHTRLPGMWPTYLDASGCKKHEYKASIKPPFQKPLPITDEKTAQAYKDGSYLKADPDLPFVVPAGKEPTSTQGDGGKKKEIPLVLPDPLVLKPNGPNPTWTPPAEEELVWLGGPSPGLGKRQLDDGSSEESEDQEVAPPEPTCQNRGFGPSSDSGQEEYTLGGMSDSTYEYLPKQYLLLGGLVEKYRSMYEQSLEVVKKHLIFRPMIPSNEDILFSGKFLVSSSTPGEPFDTQLEPENAHLTCFAGGMFAMGAKIFDRPKDLEIATKLTEGCVWSYNMTATGIMPEAFLGIPCASRNDCKWNETLYWETLDPRHEFRMAEYEESLASYRLQLKSASSWYEAQLEAMKTPAPTPMNAGLAAPEAEATAISDMDILEKRQLPDLEDISEQEKVSPAKEDSTDAAPPTKVQANIEDSTPSATLPVFPALYSPPKALSHKEYVQNRLKEERLPLGVTTITSRMYILRPEAIESVWYMYRITGDPYWREAGWRMFQAIDEHTKTPHGNSAIDDVTKPVPSQTDSMESFWLAETLKYFYLLFSDPKLVSLDDWVLNTEAHPFRRPQ